MLGVWLDGEFLTCLDLGRRRVRLHRSQFIRDAILEKLQRMGIKVVDDLALPPDRAGQILLSHGSNIQIATGHARIHTEHNHVTTTRKKTRSGKAKFG